MDTSLLPDSLTSVAGWLTGAIALGFIVYKQFNKGWSETKAEEEKARNDLVDLLSKTVDALKGQVADLQTKHNQNEKDIIRLSSVNETLTRVLQGRDEAYIKFQQEGFAAFKRTKDLHESIERLCELMEQHLDQK